jgi:hypothetical protein
MVQDINPDLSGLYLTKSYIGLKDSISWRSYIKNDGTFEFNVDSKTT